MTKTKTPGVYDFDAIGKTIASEQPVLTGDAEIVAMFQEWRQLTQRADELLVQGDIDISGGAPVRNAALNAGEALVDDVLKLESQIFATPAIGGVGLAVKVYLWMHYEDQNPREGGDTTALSEKFIRDECEDFMLAPLRDAVRFVPELAALCPRDPEQRLVRSTP